MGTCTVPTKYSEVKDIANTVPPRFRWSSLLPLFMILVCDGVHSGLALALEARSVHSPHLSFYALCLLLWTFLAIPILQLQHALAQVFQGGPLKAYGLLHPRLWGIGVAILNILILRTPHHIQSFGERLLYFGDSAAQNLPWIVDNDVKEYCESNWGKPLNIVEKSGCCIDFLNNGSWVPDRLQLIEMHFNKKVLHFPGTGSRFHFELAAACFIGVCCIFAATVVGFRFLGQVAAFTVTTFFFFLCLLTLNALQTTGGTEALQLLIHHFDVSIFYSKSSWLDASFLVLQLSTVIAGQHCLMPSYTRVGTNVLFLSLAAGFSSILVSAWTVALVYGFQGFAFTTIVEDTFQAIYSHGDAVDAGTMKGLIFKQVRKALKSQGFKNFILKRVSDKTGYEFLYVLFPWGMERLPGGRMFLIIFYFCLTLLAGVSFAGVALVFVSAIQEVARFERTHPTLVKAFVFSVCSVLSIPFFLIYFIETPVGTLPCGRYISFVLWLSTFHLGAPLVGLCFLFGILYALGREKQSESFPKYIVPLHWSFTLVGAGCAVYALTNVRSLWPRWTTFSVGIVLMSGASVLLPRAGRGAYKNNLCTLLVGDVETARALVNKVMIGRNCAFRLRRLWGITLKYGCILWFLGILLTSRVFSNGWQNNQWIPYTFLFALASDLPVTVIVLIPIFLLGIFPKIGSCFHPSPTNRWKIKDIVKKTDPKRGYKRLHVNFWEECLSPQSLWELGDATVYGKL